MHGVSRATLRAGAHMRGVTKHFRQRHDGLNHLRTCTMLHTFNAAAARTQVAHDCSGEILRHDDFNRHYWFQQHRGSLASGFFESHGPGNLECHFARVNFVIAAVVEGRLDVDHFVAGENAAFHGLFNALIDRLNVFPRHRPAHDVVDELVTFAGFLRLEADFRVAVLPTTAGLADVFAFRFSGLANRFPIRDLRFADIRFDRELAHHAVDNDFEMQLTHAADDRLAAVGIGVNLESWIFLGELGEGHAHFFLIALGLGFNCDINDWGRELD